MDCYEEHYNVNDAHCQFLNAAVNYSILPNILDKIIGITNMNIW